MPSSTRSGKRAYHYGNLRHALVDAGLTLIAEKGVRALTLREIGKRLGVSRAAAYRHYRDKAALLAAISESGFQRLAESLAAAVRRRTGDYARLEELGVAYVRFAAENRSHFQVMFGSETEAPMLNLEGKAVANQSHAVLVDTIRKGIQNGSFSGLDPLQLAGTAWSLVHGISSLGLESEPNGKAKFTRSSIRLLYTGLQGLAKPGTSAK